MRVYHTCFNALPLSSETFLFCTIAAVGEYVGEHVGEPTLGLRAPPLFPDIIAEQILKCGMQIMKRHEFLNLDFLSHRGGVC